MDLLSIVVGGANFYNELSCDIKSSTNLAEFVRKVKAFLFQSQLDI